MYITLKAARVNCGLSQSQLAKEIGVSKSTISRWERGESKISEKKLLHVTELCGVTVDSISLQSVEQNDRKRGIDKCKKK